MSDFATPQPEVTTAPKKGGVLIIASHGRRFEVHKSGGVFHAQVHCACRSTMGSGEWWPTVDEAVQAALDNIVQHERTCEKARQLSSLSQMAALVGAAATLHEAQRAVSEYVRAVRQRPTA
jgi:hypothetical protein